ncbi:MAG: extracellular solute-binding protein [Eubacteriales bacterium]
MKKKVISLMLTMAMAVSMVACSSGSSVEGTTTTTETGTESTSDESTSGDVSYSGTVVVYSPHDADPLNDGANMFMEAYPGIQVEVVAAGTGELLNRVAAEAARPIADVLWGGGADSLASFKDYFEPYVCANDDVIAADHKDADGYWIGESPLPMVIVYNKELLVEDGIEIPTSWEDLLDPALKGKIAYCAPSLSGSAYTQLVTMILGKDSVEEGWAFIEQLYINLDGKILDSSSKCHKMVADGEYHVGLTLEKSAVLYEEYENMGFIYPADGTSAVPDGIALIKDAPNPDNAKLFIDFVTSYEVQQAQSERWGRRPVRSDVPVSGSIAPLDEIVLVNYDFDWAASDKETIIEEFNEIVVNN